MWTDHVSNFIDAKIIVCGSIIANDFPKLVIHKPIKKIQWVSTFKSSMFKEKFFMLDQKLVSYEKYEYEPMLFALKVVVQFCENKNLCLEILPVSNSKDERKFFQDHFPNISVLEKDNYDSNYEKVSNESIIAGLGSTFLYETFGRCFRTAFFTFRDHFTKNIHKNFRFGWPLKLDDEGLFWCNHPDKVKMISILEYLFHASEKNWTKQVEMFRDIMHFDPGNKTIKGVLRDEGVPVIN